MKTAVTAMPSGIRRPTPTGTPRKRDAFAPDTDPLARPITDPLARPITENIELDEVAEHTSGLGIKAVAKRTDADDDDDEPSLAPEARAVIATCESELGTAPDPLRTARLHCEIARAYELANGWTEQAAEHYQRALEGAPDFLPAIRGARRLQIERGHLDAALALFDAEEKLARSPERKAQLLYEKGRLIEDQMREPAKARELYVRGLELTPKNAALLKAIEQCDRAAGASSALIETFERAANAVTEDKQHRAALVVARARLVERADEKAATKAAELYEAALEMDPHAPGALDALERIYRQNGEWRSLAVTLERQAEQSQEPHRRAASLYRLGHIDDERLGLRAESVAALEDAVEATPHDPLVLEELARGFELSENFDRLAEVLAALVELSPDKRDKVALLHRLGLVLEGPLADPEAAVQRLQQALALDPVAVPVLQALGRLLVSRKQWAALIDMHANEANATDVAERAANAHARIAEVFEVQLRDAAEAVNHHARALALVPGFATSFKALTRLYLQLERHRDLVELLERAIAEATLPSLKIAYLMKVGTIWEDTLGDPVQALHAYRRVQELSPEDLVAIHAIQRVTETAGRHKQLIEALEREAELVPDKALRVGLLHRAGTVLDDHLGDQEAALARFRSALEIDATFVPALASVGRIYYRAGRWAELLAVYERQAAACQPPEAVSLYFKMGELCEDKLGDNDAAARWYRRALELDNTYRPALRALVRRCRESRDWTGLASALELEVAAIEHAPQKAVAWFRIGQVHEEWLSDADKAMAAYSTALENRPNYRPARLALARLCAVKKQWMQLIDLLSQEVASTNDVMYATTILMQQGEIYRDELADVDLAIHCFEAALQHKVGEIPALLALEPLYLRTSSWDKLAVVYRELGNKLADPGARIAAFRELARLQLVHDLGTADDRARAHEAILAIDRDDEAALLALEAIGRDSNDDTILIGVYRRLAEVTEHAGLAASFHTDLGQALERKGDNKRALEAYKEALKKDPSLLTAIRGLSRMGDLLGNPRAMAQAARHEAELTRKPEIAARLYVRSGILRREQMNDLGAVEDFEKALEVWPDDVQAAERIIQPLLETGQVLHLIDVLSKAANSAKSAERKTAMWLEVGNLYAKRLDNLNAGITAFKRALDATPGHMAALSRLADAYERNRHWGDAVATFEQLLTLTSDDAARAEAHLKLAAIFHEHLNKIDRATKCVEAVLRTNPKHAGALTRLADIQLRSGNEAEAVTTTQKLVDLAVGPKEKGAALVRVARIQRTRGEDVAADAALSEAVSLEGPGGDAERDLKKAIERTKNWAGYAAGLATFIKRTRAEGDIGQLTTAYLEIARTYAEHMQLPARAIDALADGAKDTNGDQRVVLALARLLREAGRLDEALVELKDAVAIDPLNVETWRELYMLFESGGRRDDAQRAIAALAILGVETRVRAPRPHVSAPDNSLVNNVIAGALAADGALNVPLANMVVAIADTVGKIYTASLEQYGLTQRDRLGPKSVGSPWELASKIAKMFGTELEMYEHAGGEPMLVVEPLEPSVLIVSQTMRRLPLPQQVFLLTFGIATIATRLHPAIWLRTEELDVAVTGAVRVMAPNFTLGAPGDDANTARDTIKKVINRKWRRPMELAAEELVKQPPDDVVAWQVSVKQTMLRTAMILADDLAASFEAMRYVVEMPAVRGAALVQGSEPVRDLMRFWISNRAASLRKHLGMVAG